jgi:hypothetical protein
VRTDWLASDFNGVWRCKRSRANFVWEQIMDRAHAAPFDHADVHVIDGNETMKFLGQDTVPFQFEIADETGQSSNVATQLALASKRPTAKLPPPATRAFSQIRCCREDDVCQVRRRASVSLGRSP